MSPYRIGRIPRLAWTLIGRFLDRHASITHRPEGQSRFGGDHCQIDTVFWLRRKVRVRGVAPQASAQLGFDGGPTLPIPSGAFDLTIDRPSVRRPLRLSDLRVNQTRRPCILAPPAWKERFARYGCLPRALWACLVEVPAILQLMITRDPNQSLGIQRRMRLVDENSGVILVEDMFDPLPTPAISEKPVVVVPIYNGFHATKRMLDALCFHDGMKPHVILVDDGSDDPEIPPLLEQAKATFGTDCTLITQRENQGFVAAANIGIKAALDAARGHIVLLNSDALPPNGWLVRLLAPIEADPGIASATPVSNNAEILSVLATGTTVPDIKAITCIDETAKRLALAPVEVPTGVGFCMAMNRKYVEKVGGFDTAFGRGYGEEVDWCQRARKLGGRHVAVPSVFVGHEGAASFGTGERAKRRLSAGTLISGRYPEFDEEVRSWCIRNPLAPAKLALSLSWLGRSSSEPIPVFLGHSLGGGAETALQSEIATALETTVPGVVVLRVGGPHLLRIELMQQGETLVGDLNDMDQAIHLLTAIERRKVIYSCGVGSHDLTLAPRLLLRLLNRHSTLDVRVHDYFMISPSWNLLDENGEFSGLAQTSTDILPYPVDPQQVSGWRNHWSDVIDAAQEVTVFSNSSKQIFCEAYPQAPSKIAVRPHEVGNLPPPLQPGGQTLGILGGINQAKGGDVLQRLATRSGARPMVVIGEMDSRYRLPGPHIVHGRFQTAEIGTLAKRYGVGAWFMPSVCPETFSFATHEMLATGLPVLSFDLGAQGDAVRTAPNGRILQSTPRDTDGIAAEIEAVFGQAMIRKAS